MKRKSVEARSLFLEARKCQTKNNEEKCVRLTTTNTQEVVFRKLKQRIMDKLCAYIKKNMQWEKFGNC